jgi:hypothetical protein
MHHVDVVSELSARAFRPLYLVCTIDGRSRLWRCAFIGGPICFLCHTFSGALDIPAAGCLDVLVSLFVAQFRW